MNDSLSVSPRTGPQEGEETSPRESRVPFFAILFVLCHVPYVILYFNNLRGYSHYDFFPLALLASAFLLWKRWGGLASVTPGKKRAILTILATSLFVGGLAIAFSSSWIAYFGFLLGSASVLLATRDKETGRSNIALIVPLVLLWQPPYTPNLTGDVVLTGYLQRICTSIVSYTLDALSVMHLNTGTIISIPGRQLGVAEACSGVQSMFLYLAFTGLLSVYQRRNVLHAGILIGSTIAWTLLTNSLRILAIVLAAYYFNFDLTTGILHDSLGYLLMLLGLGLIFLFDAGINVLLDTSQVKDNDADKHVAVSNRMRIRSLALAPTKTTICLAAFAIVIFSAQAWDSVSAYAANRDRISFFSGNPIRNVSEEMMASEMLGLKMTAYRQENRERGADFGERSDVWIFSNGANEVTVSFDQAFPGWHELTRCYENAGWKTLERKVVLLPSNGEGNRPLQGVLVKMRHPTGVLGTLAFALVDARAETLEPPGEWDLINSLYNRIKGRLSPAIRTRLFGGVAFQVQTLITSKSPQDLSDQDTDAALAFLGEALAYTRAYLRK
ncbi:exosortase U [Pirellulaceae bacterium SH449]